MPIIDYNPSAGDRSFILPPSSNPFVIGGIRFLPGTNQISEEQWAMLNELPAYKRAIALRMDSGKLKVIEAPKKDAEPSIADFKLNEAVPMIQNCLDVDLLKRWQQEDSRTGSQKAIVEQLKKLSLEPTDEPPASSGNDAPVFS